MAELDIGGTTRERSPAVAPVEVLPGERELELEILLKERDEHLTRLAVSTPDSGGQLAVKNETG